MNTVGEADKQPRRDFIDQYGFATGKAYLWLVIATITACIPGGVVIAIGEMKNIDWVTELGYWLAIVPFVAVSVFGFMYLTDSEPYL